LKGQNQKLTAFSKKDLESHVLTTRGSHLNASSLVLDDLAKMNAEMEELDAVTTVEVDSNNFKYKEHILETYKAIVDPFSREIEQLEFS